MNRTRRTFLSTAAALSAASLMHGRGMSAQSSGRPANPVQRDGYDPWIEVSAEALLTNAAAASRAAGGRPVMATIKNNGYGLGLERVASVLETAPEIVGLAVVKVDEAIRLREAGVQKPVLLMAATTDDEAEELVRRDVRLAPFTDRDPQRLSELGRRLQRPIGVHLYVDTGMSRMGMPYHRALPWLESIAGRGELRVEGTFMGLTEDHDFDREQVRRFVSLAEQASQRGIDLGPLHAASSNAVTFLPETHLDMVRPGLMLFGAQVAGGREAGTVELLPALRLCARVVRVERLRPGDTVSYGRNYEAEQPVWVATIPVGHCDGYPREAVQGCRILIGQRTYPVIGAVSASHCIVEVGPEKTVEQGDLATLLGPDHPDIHPNELAEHTERSVYDILMHLSPLLPARPWTS